MSAELDKANQIANERLVSMECIQIDNGRLLNQVAEAYEELEKAGISKPKS